MNTSTKLIEKFFAMNPQGTCMDPMFEFGNLHRKEIKCSFCIDENSCHYMGECDRRSTSEIGLGWKIN